MGSCTCDGSELGTGWRSPGSVAVDDSRRGACHLGAPCWRVDVLRCWHGWMISALSHVTHLSLWAASATHQGASFHLWSVTTRFFCFFIPHVTITLPPHSTYSWVMMMMILRYFLDKLWLHISIFHLALFSFTFSQNFLKTNPLF